MPPRPVRTPRRVRPISERQAVDRLLELVAAFPEELAGLPEKVGSRAFWQEVFARPYRGSTSLQVLRELPAFTALAPRSAGRAAWRRMFAREIGPGHVRDFLRYLMAVADVRPAARPRIVSWRDAYGPDEQVQRIRPRAHDGYIANPHRGTATFQRFQGDPPYPTVISSDTHGPTTFRRPARDLPDNPSYIPRTTLSYCRWPWAWLEPRQGAYRWSIVDGALRAAAARGQTLQLRFQPYTLRREYRGGRDDAHRHPPGSSVNVPDWYWDTGASWIDAGKYCRNEPDSNDPRYLQHFGSFIRAFARRYDGHPALESVDLAYAGFWGESGGNATARTAARLADIYVSAFRRTQLLGMLGTPAVPPALARGCRLGWRADCFGDLRESVVREVPRHAAWNHTYDSYVAEIHRGGLRDAWKTAPVTMESCWNPAAWAMYGFDIDRVIEMGYRYHTSVFMPKSVFIPESAMDKLTAFDRRIGYRFELRQLLLPLAVRRGELFHLTCFADNVGCAPLYRPYALALRFSQGRTARVVRLAADLRTWLPGHAFCEEDIRLPAAFQRGEVKVALGIVDERDVPRVQFAIDGPSDGGWHPLTSIEAR